MPAAGEVLDYTITYLAMEDRPASPPPSPIGSALALIRAEDPPVSYFLYLYGTVGAAHEWTDWFEASADDQAAFVSDPGISLFTLMVDGWPGGFFMLDTREGHICDLAYFGLVPEAVGRGLGHWFLSTAVQTAWDLPNIRRLTVNTCTLDHRRALPLYQRVGFVPERQVKASRVSTRPRSD